MCSFIWKGQHCRFIFQLGLCLGSYLGSYPGSYPGSDLGSFLDLYPGFDMWNPFFHFQTVNFQVYGILNNSQSDSKKGFQFHFDPESLSSYGFDYQAPTLFL